MMTVRDSETGGRVAVGRRGWLAIQVGGRLETASGLRGLLLADVLRRAGELTGLQVFVHLPGATMPEWAGSFGIGPVEHDDPGEPDVRINDPGPGLGLSVAAATIDGADAVSAGIDLGALRLALLTVPHGTPAELGSGGLADAAAELVGLRGQVAAWANEPSGAPAVAYARAALDAVRDDADTPAAVGALRGAAADDSLAPGARFETVVLVDRLLALDLPAEIGRR